MSARRVTALAVSALDLLWTYALYPLLIASLGGHATSGGWSTLVVDLILTSIIWYFVSIASACVASPQTIPGPRLAKATVAWKAFHIAAGTYTPRLRELHHKHGCLVQIAPSEYSLNDPFHIIRANLVKVSFTLHLILAQTAH